MKILITGVAGFIGSNLAFHLLKREHEIFGIDNLSYGSLDNIDTIKDENKFHFSVGDICNPSVIKDIKVDLIIHLASQKIPRYSSAYRTLTENALMLKNIIDKCLIDKCKIIFASTSDVYGKNEELPFTEESNLVLGATTVKRWSYALSKIYGEQLIIANNEEYDLNYTIVRFFGSYGPNQNLTWWGGPQSLFIHNALFDKTIEVHGDGQQTRTFTFIEDTVAGIIKCIESQKSNKEIFNIASNPKEEIKILDLAHLIWKMINGEKASPKINIVPYSNFGKYEDVMRRVPSIDKLKEYFDYQPKFDLEQGLQKTIEWQKSVDKV